MRGDDDAQRLRRRYWLARPLIRAAAAADLVVERNVSRVRRLLEGVLPSVLDDDELDALSADLYERRGETRYEGPTDWEARWLETVFPPPPAHVLVGGAGYGRECRFLVERGYTATAYEPGVDGARTCTQIAPCLRGTHQDLVRAVAGAPSPLRPLAEMRYDLVLLGWGSLTHVLDIGRRTATLDACATLTDGPILASVRMGAISRDDDRFVRAGRRLAAGIGGRAVPPGVIYQPQHGFTASLDERELVDQAARLRRRLVIDEQPGITAVAFLSARSRSATNT